MKILVTICRFIVGALFIFSGFIKLNDPLGFSYKLVDYFDENVLNLTFLIPYALMLAVVLVIVEVLLGVFLIIGYKPKNTVWSILAMIIFFTILTGYTYFSGYVPADESILNFSAWQKFDPNLMKVTDCGCFGDAIPLRPWESFYKDVVLMVLIIILVIGVRYINPIMNKLGLTAVSLVSFLLCLLFGYYVLMHLPAMDFRAYKIGTDIRKDMTVPEDAPAAIIDYHWKFNVDGEEKVITTSGSYPKVDGELISYETDEIRAPYEPPIINFMMEKDGEDYTDQFLDEPKLVMVVMYSLDKSEDEGMEKLKSLQNIARKNGYKIIGLSASGSALQIVAKETYDFDFDIYLCDDKTLKAIVRSNPGVLILKNGIIDQKVHWNDIDELEF